MDRVGKSVDSLLERSRSIDRHLAEYREIVQGTDHSIQVLSSSSLVQFFVSALVLLRRRRRRDDQLLVDRAADGARWSAARAFIGNFRMADIAALVIIMVEISMGLFLMESMRITRLFPVIGALPDKLRVRMMADHVHDPA